jgi:hypothetical protein
MFAKFKLHRRPPTSQTWSEVECVHASAQATKFSLEQAQLRAQELGRMLPGTNFAVVKDDSLGMDYFVVQKM